MIKYLIVISLLQFLYANDSYYYKNHKQVNLTNVRGDYYETDGGHLVGISNKLILKVNNKDNLKKYLLDFNLTVEKVLSENVYLLKTEDKMLTIDISNRLSEKGDVVYAHPDFIQKRVIR